MTAFTVIIGVWGLVAFAILVMLAYVSTRALSYTLDYYDDKKIQQRRAGVAILLTRICMSFACTVWLSGLTFIPMYFWSNASGWGYGQGSPLTAAGVLIAYLISAWILWQTVFKGLYNRAVADLTIACSDNSSLIDGLLDAVKFCPVMRPVVKRAIDRR